jgi:hypothetical protein
MPCRCVREWRYSSTEKKWLFILYIVYGVFAFIFPCIRGRLSRCVVDICMLWEKGCIWRLCEWCCLSLVMSLAGFIEVLWFFGMCLCVQNEWCDFCTPGNVNSLKLPFATYYSALSSDWSPSEVHVTMLVSVYISRIKWKVIDCNVGNGLAILLACILHNIVLFI